MMPLLLLLQTKTKRNRKHTKKQTKTNEAKQRTPHFTQRMKKWMRELELERDREEKRECVCVCAQVSVCV